MGQTTRRPSIWHSKYFHNFLYIDLGHSKLFIFIFIILLRKWKGFCKEFCKILWKKLYLEHHTLGQRVICPIGPVNQHINCILMGFYFIYPFAYCAMLCCMYVALVALAKAAHSWAKLKKPAQNEIFKNCEIEGSYLCLQKFDKFWIRSAGNHKLKLCEFPDSWMEKHVKSLSANLFFGGF